MVPEHVINSHPSRISSAFEIGIRFRRQVAHLARDAEGEEGQEVGGVEIRPAMFLIHGPDALETSWQDDRRQFAQAVRAVAFQ